VVENKTAARPMGRRPPGKWTGGKFAPKRKVCPFCASRSKVIDYKDTAMLGRFISDRGKIEPRRRTGTCNRHQHILALAIKQARHVALLPFVPEHIHQQGLVPPLNINPVVVENKPVAEVKPAVENAPVAPSAETQAIT
jgi:small subunit ribosomal protein S18